jgi:hypothetical protein
MSVRTNERGYQPPLPVGTSTLSHPAPAPDVGRRTSPANLLESSTWVCPLWQDVTSGDDFFAVSVDYSWLPD